MSRNRARDPRCFTTYHHLTYACSTKMRSAILGYFLRASPRAIPRAPQALSHYSQSSSTPQRYTSNSAAECGSRVKQAIDELYATQSVKDGTFAAWTRSADPTSNAISAGAGQIMRGHQSVAHHSDSTYAWSVPAVTVWPYLW